MKFRIFVSMLAAFTAFSQEKPIDLLMKAIEAKNLTAMKSALEAKPDVNSSDNEMYTTPLEFAINQDFGEGVELLILAGVDVKKTDERGSPLVMAIQRSAGTVVPVLIKAGADVNQKGESSATPLFYCIISREAFTGMGGDEGEEEKAYKSAITSARALIRAGANINAVNEDGDTPLHRAVMNFHTEMIDFLLANKANVWAKNNEGNTPLKALQSQMTSPYYDNDRARAIVQKLKKAMNL